MRHCNVHIGNICWRYLQIKSISRWLVTISKCLQILCHVTNLQNSMERTKKSAYDCNLATRWYKYLRNVPQISSQFCSNQMHILEWNIAITWSVTVTQFVLYSVQWKIAIIHDMSPLHSLYCMVSIVVLNIIWRNKNIENG